MLSVFSYEGVVLHVMAAVRLRLRYVIGNSINRNNCFISVDGMVLNVRIATMNRGVYCIRFLLRRNFLSNVFQLSKHNN